MASGTTNSVSETLQNHENESEGYERSVSTKETVMANSLQSSESPDIKNPAKDKQIHMLENDIMTIVTIMTIPESHTLVLGKQEKSLEEPGGCLII